ncbi:MAG TPA: hypothetical protein VJG83_05055 [archaeon]|nr:hypothetical protein [archaeon]
MENEFVKVPGCKETEVKELYHDNQTQISVVQVARGGEIPMHCHDCAATMIITKGSAKAIGKDYKIVKNGDIVVKKPKEAHGFTQIKEPFEFISVSEGNGIMHNGEFDIKYI